MDVQVGDVVMLTETVHYRGFRVSAHAAAAHLVRGEQAGAVGFHGQVVDGVSGLVPAGVPVRVQVHGLDGFGAGGELDFGHGEVGLAQALPEVVGDRVVQYRAAVVSE